MKPSERLREEIRQWVPATDRLKVCAAFMRDLARLDADYALKSFRSSRRMRAVFLAVGSMQLALAAFDVFAGARWSVLVGQAGLAVGFLAGVYTETIQLRSANMDLERNRGLAADAEDLLSEMIAATAKEGDA